MGNNVETHWFPKACLIVVSLSAAFFSAAVAIGSDADPLLILLIFPAVGLLYPIAGAGIVFLCEELRDWAYEYECKDWSREVKIFYGAIWPVVLPVCIILYVFLGIIHRLYNW